MRWVKTWRSSAKAILTGKTRSFGEVAHSTRRKPQAACTRHHFDGVSRSPINPQKTCVDLPTDVLIRSIGTAQLSGLSLDDFLAETTLTVT